MNCAEAEQFFDAYLDSELSGTLRLEFDAHRLRCPVCQQKLAMMEACEHILARDSRAPTPPGDFTNRVMQEIEERRVIAWRGRRRRLVVTAAVALQAAAVLVFAVLWWGYEGSTASPSLDKDAFHEQVAAAIEDKDPVKVYDLMLWWGEQLLAAGSNLEDDVSSLPRYATNLSILGDLSFPSDTMMPGPWEVLNPFHAPAATEETEPVPEATGPFSL